MLRRYTGTEENGAQDTGSSSELGTSTFKHAYQRRPLRCAVGSVGRVAPVVQSRHGLVGDTGRVFGAGENVDLYLAGHFQIVVAHPPPLWSQQNSRPQPVARCLKARLYMGQISGR